MSALPPGSDGAEPESGPGIWLLFVLIAVVWYGVVGRHTLPGRFSYAPQAEFINTPAFLNSPDPMAAADTPLLPKLFVLFFFILLYLVAYQDWIHHMWLFLGAAVLMVLGGTRLEFYSAHGAGLSLWDRRDVFCFLIGMNLITVILAQGGLFDYWAKKIALLTKGDPWRILVWFCVLTYIVSLFVNNLTTMLVLVPMMLSLSRYIRFNPQIALIGMVVASNLGGASTMIGDFPNMLIGTEAHLAFVEFLVFMLPICLFEFVLLLFYLRAREKAGLMPSSSKSAPIVPAVPGAEIHFFKKLRLELRQGLQHPVAVRRALTVLAVLLVGFLLSDWLHFSPAYVAMGGGIVALFYCGLPVAGLLKDLDIRDVVFLGALFVLVGAADASGLLNWFGNAIAVLSFGNLLVRCLLVMWTAGLVTAVMNAGPTTALFMPLVMGYHTPAPHHMYWWALSLGVLAGSSATLTGATAGSVASGMMEKFEGVPLRISFREYARIGIPVALMFLAASSVYLAAIYKFV